MSEPDVVDRFDAIDIKDFQVQAFEYRGMEKLVIRLSDAPRAFKSKKAKTARDYELQFNRVLGGFFEADGGAGRIFSWKGVRTSDFLSEVVSCRRDIIFGESFCQFGLVFERGRIDAVARDFHLTVMAWGTLVGGNGGSGGEVVPFPPPGQRGAE